MKSSARAGWAREFTKTEMPRPTKALAAELALHVWHGLSQDLILSAWDFDGAYGGDSDADAGSEDDEEAFFDVEYGHDDVDVDDLALIGRLGAG
jgi:hypothetical protein